MSSLTPNAAIRISDAVARLDNWFETMRGQGGYSGPIPHWWESSLLYCGPMVDWRYEGIISGYLTLYARTGDTRWRARACRAGDDVCDRQLPSGVFLNSSFQQGPVEGGTPHEAAVDIGLLELAHALRSEGDPTWHRYYEAAARNLEAYQIGQLWNGEGFLDQPWNTTLVPNKNGTTLEALLLYEEMSGRDVERYVLAAAGIITRNQILDGSARDGATVHVGTGAHQLTIGIYTARCVNALLRLLKRYPNEEYLDAARAATRYLLRLIQTDGTWFGHYSDGTLVANPRWLSPSGDILRALLLMRHFMVIPDEAIGRLTEVLLASQLPSGGLMTGRGLAHKGLNTARGRLPEFRDVLPAVGWCDKAFRALALLVDKPGEQVAASKTTVACVWKGSRCQYEEDEQRIQLRRSDGALIYSWAKGDIYPRIYQI